MQVNVAGLRRNIKNLAHNYSDAQVKVREATSNDPWGPSATIMAEIADLTQNVVAFSEIMQMIWKRLNDHGKNWRHVYKALILLEYLIKTGSEKVAQQCKENIFAIQTLREFVYFEEGKDQGTHVREKAKQLVNLLRDDERLKNERIKALKAKERFAQHPSGFGSDGYIDGPSQRDMPPGWQEEPKTVSELEMVRPQTAGEEELQLQLAMAMSREEAEQEEAKRRSDDVRLQLALSQSEQDFKPSKKEEPQSHLLDLLDISLGAASISSPPPLSGAIGGLPTDPWGTPARAASQLSDPWSGTSSPQIDPWQPAAAVNAALLAGRGSVPPPLISTGMNGESWALRTQSPSVVSGSSGEGGWLHNNGTNGNLNGGAAALGAAGVEASALGLDPWLSTKTTTRPTPTTTIMSSVPVASSQQLIDPWITDKATDNVLDKGALVPAPSLDDPWKPAAKLIPEDPWQTVENAKKISPDLDEFDIISNRNKTAADAYALSNSNLLTANNSNINNHNNLNNHINNNIFNGNSNNNNMSHNNNNNIASLLDDMDPLAPSNLLMTNGKKQLKTPQAFLGENSALVNLDNLIKPVVPQTQTGSAAYNPFSDTVVPPKTNLFQQQQPAVPSINQLKQQQPFAMTINQDPWAPLGHAANAASQFDITKWDFGDTTETTIFTEAIVHSSDNTPSELETLKTIDFSCMQNKPISDNNSNWLFNPNNNFMDVFNTATTTTTTAATTLNNTNNNNNWSSNMLNDNLCNNINNNNNNNQSKKNKTKKAKPEKITFGANFSPKELKTSKTKHEKKKISSGVRGVDNKSYCLSDWDMPQNNDATPIANAHNLNNNIFFDNYKNSNYTNNNTKKNSLDEFKLTLPKPKPKPRPTTADSSPSSAVTASSYISAFTASLADTPGLIIKPLTANTNNDDALMDFGDSPFDYGSNILTTENNNNNIINNNNTNNNNTTTTTSAMPWMKPEAAASNPFLS